MAAGGGAGGSDSSEGEPSGASERSTIPSSLRSRSLSISRSFSISRSLPLSFLFSFSCSLSFCALLFVAGCGAVSPGARPVPPPAPGVALQRPADLEGPLSDLARPLAYRLLLAVDPDAATFYGEVEIDVELARPTSQLWLHSVAMSIRRVELELDGQRFAPSHFEAANPLLGIHFGRTVPAGRLVVRIRYHGLTTADEVGLFTRLVRGKRYLYSQAEAQYARRIVPCFDEPRHKVPWTVSVTAPGGAQVLGNAAAEQDRALPDGRHLVSLAPTAPMPSYNLALAVGPFELVEVGRLGRRRFPTRIAVPRGIAGGAAAATSAAAHALARSVAGLERWFGAPLPLDKLDLVAVPRFFGAMENPGLITFDADGVIGDARDARYAARFATIMTHELAHQWFGNLITPARWEDLWISESLATWVTHQTLPELPELEAATLRVLSHLDARRFDAAAPQAVLRPLGQGRDIFDLISYDKGAAIISMMARWLGAARLTAALRDFVTAHAEHSVSTEQLAAALGKLDPRAEAVLLHALRRPGVPVVDFELSCGAQPGPPVLRVTPPGDGPLPICVRFDGGAAPRSSCQIFDRPGELRLPPGPCPRWVVANDDMRGYYRARWTGVDRARFGPPPPLAQQSLAERLALASDAALGLASGDAPPPFLLTGIEQRSRVGATSSTPATPAQDLADLELLLALEPLAADDELPALRALVARRGAAMLRQPLGEGQLALRRQSFMIQLFLDLPWPAAITEPALAAVRAPRFATDRDHHWMVALRSGRPEVVAELLAAAPLLPGGDGFLFGDAAAELGPLWVDSTPALRALWAVPSAALPALLEPFRRGALPWLLARNALVQLLSRRGATAAATLSALVAARADLVVQLPPPTLAYLLRRTGALCDLSLVPEVELLLAAAAPRLLGAGELRREVLASIELCVSRRLEGKGLRGRGIVLPPP